MNRRTEAETVHQTSDFKGADGAAADGDDDDGDVTVAASVPAAADDDVELIFKTISLSCDLK